MPGTTQRRRSAAPWRLPALHFSPGRVCPHPNERAAQRWLDHVWLYLRILWCKLIARQRATRQESEMANVYVLNTSGLSAQISINNSPTHNLSAWRLSTQTAPQVPYFSVPRTRNVDQNGFSN